MIWLVKILLFGVAAAMASSGYPPVSVLEAELNARPGAELPKLFPWNGRLFRGYYVKSSSNDKGEYYVTIQLR